MSGLEGCISEESEGQIRIKHTGCFIGIVFESNKKKSPIKVSPKIVRLGSYYSLLYRYFDKLHCEPKEIVLKSAFIIVWQKT